MLYEVLVEPVLVLMTHLEWGVLVTAVLVATAAAVAAARRRGAGEMQGGWRESRCLRLGNGKRLLVVSCAPLNKELAGALNVCLSLFTDEI